MTLYQNYMTQAEYQEIANGKYSSPDSYPHCNIETFHEPGTCAYCDGHYLKHPGFTPPTYATREANGWGGNRAPIVDDVKAALEDRDWKAFVDEFMNGDFQAKQKQRILDAVERITSRFRKSR